MAYFLQQLINGLTLGAIYGLIALGYTMVYGIIGMINFAHGDVFMVGAFLSLISFVVLSQLGLNSAVLAIVVALLFSMGFAAVYGWTIERIAYRPLRGSFILYRSDGFDVRLSYLQVVIIILTAVLMLAFTLLIQKTSLGRAQRACEQDRGMAALLGVNVDRTISLTFVIGAMLAAVAGLMFDLYYGVIDFFIGFLAGIQAFTAAVLGGIGSLPGAILGGLLIGLIQSFWSAYFSVEYKDVAVFVILVLVLIFRPSGLLGRPEIEKV